MRITKKYSHLNGEEWLLVHENDTYQEILASLWAVDAEKYRADTEKKAPRVCKSLYDPLTLTQAFALELTTREWAAVSYSHYVAHDPDQIELLAHASLHEQERYLQAQKADKILSTHRVDHVKNRVAIEMRFDRPELVAYDLYGVYLPFYASGMIGVGIEILPTRKMQNDLPCGCTCYEHELDGILRYGKTNPPMPLVLVGLEP